MGESIKFNVGDVVHLRSGGPAMVVTGHSAGNDAVKCGWFERVNQDWGNYQELYFEPASLIADLESRNPI